MRQTSALALATGTIVLMGCGGSVPWQDPAETGIPGDPGTCTTEPQVSSFCVTRRHGSLPLPWSQPDVAVLGRRIYLTGGLNDPSPDAFGEGRRTFFGEIESTNVVGGWHETSAIPEKIQSFAFGASGRFLYLVAGVTYYPETPSTAVYFSPVAADGSLEGWRPTTPLPSAGLRTSVVAYDGRLYAFTGDRELPAGNREGAADKVYVTDVSQDGSLGPWRETTAFSDNRHGSQVVAWNHVLYALAPEDNFPSTADVCDPNALLMSRIEDDGSLGPWTAANPPSFLNWTGTLIAANNHLYLVSGNGHTLRPGSPFDAGTFAAPLRPDGQVGDWQRIGHVGGGQRYAFVNGTLLSFGSYGHDPGQVGNRLGDELFLGEVPVNKTRMSCH